MFAASSACTSSASATVSRFCGRWQWMQGTIVRVDREQYLDYHTGWTIFHLPSTPRVMLAVRSATSGGRRVVCRMGLKAHEAAQCWFTVGRGSWLVRR